MATITGTSGNDSLAGGPGVDTYNGLAGNDTYTLRTFGDKVVESANAGTDTVKAYFDFTLPANVENLTLLGNYGMADVKAGAGSISVARVADPANAIVGSWSMAGGGEEVVATFLADGSYVLAINGATDPYGQAGMERGTYSWNAATGAISFTTATDTNGTWGLHPEEPTSIVVNGNTGTGTSINGDFVFSRVVSATEPMVGSWYIDGLAPSRVKLVATFLSDGTFMLADEGREAQDPSGTDGIEHGTYTWNAATGAFTYALEADTNGNWGFSGFAPTSVVGRGANGTGNALANVISGDAGDNILRGLGGADKLSGGNGKDRLYGGNGNDTLNGGGAADKFVFENAAGSGVDRIADFTSGSDKIWLDDDGFAGFGQGGTRALDPALFRANLGGTAKDGDDRILYETDTGALYYDADGTGAMAKVQIGVVVGHPVLASTDFQITG